jgi:hypothetical protein
MKFSVGSVLAAVALSAFVAAPAAARTPYSGSVGAVGTTSIDIDLAGWATWGTFLVPGSNTEVFIDVGAGTAVTGFEYINLSFTTENGSWLSEFTLSVNNFDGSEFMDWSPSTVTDSGSFGPGSGTWSGGAGGPGAFGPGGSFVVADGTLWVTVYDSFDDPFGDTGLVRDALVSSGTLRVFLAPIPEPGTYGMMALGLLAIGAAMRQRQKQR